MKKFCNDLKMRIKSNWKIILIGIIIFFTFILINNTSNYTFDNSGYFSVQKSSLELDTEKTPQLEKDVIIKQNFISQKNNLRRIGIFSIMPSISTDSNVNVKVIDVQNNNLLLDQNVFLGGLKNLEYFDVNIENQFNSKGKEYQIIITGIDGDQFNTIQFPYSAEKSEYLKGCYIGEKLQEKDLLLKFTYTENKKVILIWTTMIVCILLITVYGINKQNLKEDLKFLAFSIALGFFVCVSISILPKIKKGILINVFKDNIGMITSFISIILGTLYFFILKMFSNKKIKLETAFLFVIIPIGLLYCFAIPFEKVPDEITHVSKAIDISYGHFFSKANENNEAELEYTKSLKEIFNIDTKDYEYYLHRISKEVSEEKIIYKFSNMALYSPICHLPQATGIFISRMLGASLIVQLYSARIVNFAVTVSLIYFAIKYIPIKKSLVFLIACLPISLQEIVSISSDSLTIGISLFYISYILYLRYEESKKQIDKKDWIILICSSIVVSMCKIVYLPLCLLLFLIPENKTKGRKDKIIKVCILFASVTVLNLLWTVYSSRFLIEYNVGVNSKEQVLFVLKHPIQYIFIMFRTINVNLQIWWLGLVGHDLGIFGLETLNISYSWILPLSILLLSLLFVTEDEEKDKIDIITKILFGFVFIAIAVLVFTSLYVQFNKLESRHIGGIQPRYFIPILLMIPIIFNNKKIIFKGKFENKYILMFIIFMNIHAISCIINYFLI